MTSIAFFNNKGGVGKTTLIYHLGWMFAELGLDVLMADCDPQANLTAFSMSASEIDLIESDEISSIYDMVAPTISGGRPTPATTFEVTDRLHLVAGDLELSNVEDALSQEWTNSLGGSSLVKQRAFNVTSAIANAIGQCAEDVSADVVLIDVGPNLGAINRATLLAADYVVVPVAPDIFSLQGLTNVGQGLNEWRVEWAKRLADAPGGLGEMPTGGMLPIGYVVSRFSTYAGERATHFRKWINRVPETFHRDVLRQKGFKERSVEDDVSCLAWLKDYRSLMPMAHEARKPIFRLRPADGAIGGHQQAVLTAFQDFESLARSIAEAAELDLDD